jgi:hypothetical protein
VRQSHALAPDHTRLCECLGLPKWPRVTTLSQSRTMRREPADVFSSSRSAKCLELFLGELVDKAAEVAKGQDAKTLSAAHMCAYPTLRGRLTLSAYELAARPSRGALDRRLTPRTCLRLAEVSASRRKGTWRFCGARCTPSTPAGAPRPPPASERVPAAARPASEASRPRPRA